MDAISYTAARQNLAATMDKVCQDREAVIITRKREQSVVMLSLEEFDALQETSYLLQSPVNAKRLMKATEALDAGRGKKRKINLGE